MSKAIEKAVIVAGGQALLARAVGVAPAVIWQWLNAVRPVPPVHCPAIEAATAVRCEEIRPDLTWERDDRTRVTGYRVPLPAPPTCAEPLASAEQ
jgi:DNA-binding transcriptional regulator YdaS (Cro superfamily)